MILIFNSFFVVVNYQLSLLLFISSIFLSFGQQERQIKHGKILEFQKPISGVHLYNLNTTNGTTTLSNGSFELLVKLNDTIIISHVKYRSLKIVFTKRYLNQESLIIYMDEMTNLLDTVAIKNHNLTGNLNIDTQKEKFTKIDQKYKLIEEYMRLAKMPVSKFYVIEFEKPPINNVDPTVGLSGGVGLGIGFKFKDLILRRELRAKRNFPKEIITDFGISYFTEDLKIPKEKIHHFITYCEYKSIMQLYRNNEIMKVLMILQEESIEYLKVKD